MVKITDASKVNVGDFVYVESSGFILEVTETKAEVGKYTMLETVRFFITYTNTGDLNETIYKFE